MSDKPPVYRLADNKVLCVSFSPRSHRLDGDPSTYEIPWILAQLEPTAENAESAPATDPTREAERV
jgi:hypothetical protein